MDTLLFCDLAIRLTADAVGTNEHGKFQCAE